MRAASHRTQGESGQALVIALLALALGLLLVVGFLYYASTSQLATKTTSEQLATHYSADAGVEHALWRLTNEAGFTGTVSLGPPVAYTIPINSRTVAITVTRVFTP